MDAVATSLVAWALATCGAVRVDVDWVGVDPATIGPGELVWSGDPCRSAPELHLTAVVDGTPRRAVSVRPQLQVWVSAPVAARDVAMGEAVQATSGLVRVDRRDGKPVTDGVARRALVAGTPLTDRVVGEPVDVRAGADVALVVTSGPLTVRAPGHALGSGCVGARIKVVNDATHTELTGVVRDAHTVELGETP